MTELNIINKIQIAFNEYITSNNRTKFDAIDGSNFTIECINEYIKVYGMNPCVLLYIITHSKCNPDISAICTRICAHFEKLMKSMCECADAKEKNLLDVKEFGENINFILEYMIAMLFQTNDIRRNLNIMILEWIKLDKTFDNKPKAEKFLFEMPMYIHRDFHYINSENEFKDSTTYYVFVLDKLAGLLIP